ncbi:RNA-dependent RNA polymerase 1 [Cytospora mali]|uniref:RNA-dependent RNA polymerase n=1 Tax=Cytospora mali TaxID=578113 RepID=A0A194UV12_CYTMA|nr:RNA-dependent RNA polymerase 1 [Valsa mali var. pyri (nom. inval.)]
MSRAVARQIQDRLGLRTSPSAVQGRLGSAKGMWVIDVTDTTDDVWIETYPSQRKWELDWDTVDKEQRTLEVLNVPSKPRSARLNLQFLPVIEDRAKDKDEMRKAAGYLLQSNLENDLRSQKEALERPIQFRQWIHENSSHKHDRALNGHVPYQGGLPQEDEEIMNCMLDAGFQPTANKFLADLTFAMQRKKCETLKKKLNITVGRSANLYMVVDFLGILEENEIHVGFSTVFEADNEWNKTMIQGEAIVARSPAHFISDMQKVKVVFKPELADLTDVVIFSSKGDVPLADKLSGGDYDGDLAWVCWDPRLVVNFENAKVQEQPELNQFIRKDTVQFRQILKSHKKDLAAAVSEMMEKSFAFNLTKSMLGTCTNYKESLCYSRGNVDDDVARTLSTLLSNLVDQAKQGIEFTDEDFRSLKKDLAKNHGVRQEYDKPPAYKSEHWSSDVVPKHIIDYLKFGIAQPIITKELNSFNKALNEDGPEFYDQDLVSYHKKYDQLARDPSELGMWIKSLHSYLGQEIEKVSEAWDRLTASWPEKVQRTYELWQAIQPDKAPLLSGQQSTTNSAAAMETLLLGGELSHWELWKASFAFHKFKKKRFPWQMAGRQLCHIKAQVVCAKTPGAALAPASVVPLMHAGLRPDPKFVKLMVAMMEGQGSQFMDQHDHRDDDDDDE